jgi:hypothetical protein
MLDIYLYVSELKLKFALPDTNAFIPFFEANLGKKTDISGEFYSTCTMQRKIGKKILFEDWYVFTRFACHGYHYLFCKIMHFHFDPKLIVYLNIAMNRVNSII